jgi:hypothetical protein
VDNWRVPIKKITAAEGASYLANLPEALPMATRYLLQEMQLQHPGGTIELRVPPFGAVQLVGGLNHRRGTPPNVVELDPTSFLALCDGSKTWADLKHEGKLITSGSKAEELSNLFPLGELQTP